MRTITALLFLSLVIFSCSKIEPEGSEEKNIYSLVLNNSLVRPIDTTRITVDSYTGFEWVNVKQIIIRPSSQFDKVRLSVLEKNLSGLEKSTYYNFLKRNKKSISLEHLIYATEVPISPVSEDELENIFNYDDLNAGWGYFYEKYPGAQGILNLSRIGFKQG